MPSKECFIHTYILWEWKSRKWRIIFLALFFLKDKRSKNCRWYVGRKSFYSSRKNSSHKNCAIKAALRAWKKTTTTAVKSWKEKVRKSWTECKNCKESSCSLVFRKQISETCCHTASFTVFYILSFFCCTNPLSGYSVIRDWSNFDVFIKIEFPDKNFYVSGFCQCVWTSVFQSRSRLSKNLEHAIRTRKADLFLALNEWVTHYEAPFSPSSKTR